MDEINTLREQRQKETPQRLLNVGQKVLEETNSNASLQ
jgi:hypothetical protein